jgi:hypothetical protein
LDITGSFSLHGHIMDKELEQKILQIMERLLAHHSEKINALAEASHENAGLSRQIEAYWKRTTACQVSSMACPKKPKAGPEGTEAAVDTFKGSSDKIEAKGLEANSEATEAVVE